MARAYCACSRFGWELFWTFLLSIILSSFLLSLGDGMNDPKNEWRQIMKTKELLCLSMCLFILDGRFYLPLNADFGLHSCIISVTGGGGQVVRWCWINFLCRGVLNIWTRAGQGPTALAVGAGGGCLDIFSLVYQFSFLSPSLWETVRYRLKYFLKRPLSPKQPTNRCQSRRCQTKLATAEYGVSLCLGGVKRNWQRQNTAFLCVSAVSNENDKAGYDFCNCLLPL